MVFCNIFENFNVCRKGNRNALYFQEDEREYNITFDKVTAMQQRVYELLLENNA